MFSTKPKALSLTLVFYIALALVLATGSQANSFEPVPAHRREHVNLNRLIKKRATDTALPTVIGVAGGPPTVSPSGSGTSAGSATTSLAATPVKSAVTTSSSTSVTDPFGLSSIINSLTNTATTSSTVALTTTTSSASLSSTSSSSILPNTTSVALPTTSAAPLTSAVIEPSSSQVTITTAAAAASATTSAVATSSASKITRTTLTVLIVIAASVGGVAIIWTIIRKWKFNKSSQFEDRMRPIDWQPTADDHDSGLPVHRRAGSSASSFHSGSGHDGYGSTQDHARSASPLPPVPDHDFTAGPTHLAPVGGYADLARGASPQPQMQQMYHEDTLSHGPSMVQQPQYDQYGVPLHHQTGYNAHGGDAYDYNGGY